MSWMIVFGMLLLMFGLYIEDVYLAVLGFFILTSWLGIIFHLSVLVVIGIVGFIASLIYLVSPSNQDSVD